MEQLGDRVMRLRQQRGISQRKFAKLIGTSPGLISFIERNRNKPNFRIVGRMAKVLGTSTDYLIFGEETSLEPTEELIEQLTSEIFDVDSEDIIPVSEKEKDLVKRYNILSRLADLSRTDLDIVLEIIERLEESS